MQVETEIAFCEMTFSSSGVMRGSEKVKALENLPPPKNKIKLKSLTYMMQSNSDFIPNFLKNISILRELLNSGEHFKLTETHQKIFNNILDKFKK